MRFKMEINIRGSTQSILLTTLLLMVNYSVTSGSDFPTYDHPRYPGYKCYKCPPGFRKVNDCIASRSEKPEWAECSRCPEMQFSQRWNTDERCWDHDTCEKGQEEVYNGGTIGPTKCACTGAMLENSKGHCVKGISLSDHKAEMEKLQVFYATTKSTKSTKSSCRPCPTQPPCTSQPPQEGPTCSCQTGTKDISPAFYVLLGFPGGIIISLVFYFFVLRRLKKTESSSKVDSEKQAMTGRDGVDAKPFDVDIKKNSRDDESDLKTDETTTKDRTEQVVDIPQGKGRAVPLPQETEEENDILDKALLIMEDSVVNINEVDAILRHIFKLHSSKCTKILHANNKDMIQSLRHGFREWKEVKAEKRDIQTLLASLRADQRNFLADKIRDNLGIIELQGAEGIAEEVDPLDIAFQICETELSVDERVTEFFRSQLQLSNKEVNILSQEKKTLVRQALSRWRDKNTKENATVEKLIQHFRDADMGPYADIILERMQKECPDYLPRTDIVNSSSVEEPDPSDLKALPFELCSTTGTAAESPQRESSGSSIPSTIGSSIANSNSRRSDSSSRHRLHSDNQNEAPGSSSSLPQNSGAVSSPTGDSVCIVNEGRGGTTREVDQAPSAPTGNALWDESQRVKEEAEQSCEAFLDLDNTESDPSEKMKSANRRLPVEDPKMTDRSLPTSKSSEETVPLLFSNGNCVFSKKKQLEKSSKGSKGRRKEA